MRDQKNIREQLDRQEGSHNQKSPLQTRISDEKEENRVLVPCESVAKEKTTQ